MITNAWSVWVILVQFAIDRRKSNGPHPVPEEEGHLSNHSLRGLLKENTAGKNEEDKIVWQGEPETAQKVETAEMT